MTSQCLCCGKIFPGNSRFCETCRDLRHDEYFSADGERLQRKKGTMSQVLREKVGLRF